MASSRGASAGKTAFLDLFSDRAHAYAAARPTYPDELYRYLVSVAPGRRLAWDCATGNGQAARDLARYFERVVATDASATQIAHAVPVANVEYRVAPAEDSGIPAASVELVVVAQALHWLEHAAFAKEVRRVTVPGGMVAAWCYGACHAGGDVEDLLRNFENQTLGPYWNERRKWVDEGYRTIPFPFAELQPPAFELRADWSLSQLGDYLSSWSAVAEYRRRRGEDPVAPLLERIGTGWDSAEIRTVTWPLGLRIGRVQ